MDVQHSRIRRRLWVVAVSLTMLAALEALPGPVAAARPAVPGPLPAASARPTHDAAAASTVLVRFRDGTTAVRQAAARARAGVRHERGGSVAGLEVVRPADGQTVDEAVARLEADPAVASAEPNIHLTLAANPADEPWRAAYQWGLENAGGDCIAGSTRQLGLRCVADADIDATAAWPTATGAGVTVAVLDDGLDFSQSELASQAWTNAGETGTDASGADRATNGIDDDGNGYVDDVHGVNLCTADASPQTLHRAGVDWHGTAVAAVLGSAANGAYITGVAPDVRLMAVRWLIGGTCDTIFDAVAAIDYAVANGAAVINASWGAYDDSPALRGAVASAATAGVLIVAAAGNDGTTDRFYPAAYDLPNVISVAAMGPDGSLADFSNLGSTVDIAAPGVAIAAPCVDPSPATCPAPWMLLDGTSFAAPHVSGIAALVLQARPDLAADAAGLRGKILGSGWRDAAMAGSSTTTGRVADAGYSLDSTAPAAPSIRVHAQPGAAIGSTSAPMTIAWPAVADASGIDSYRVRYRPTGSTWRWLATDTTARSVAVTLAFDRSYDIQVSARDRGGNATSSIITTTPRQYSESSSLAAYSGAWSLVWNTSYAGGKARTTSTAGRSVTYRFTGRSIAWIAARGPTRGSARVYVDGTYAATVSLYATTTSYRHVVWNASWGSAGTHRVKIVVVGTLRHPRVDMDGMVVAR